MRMFVSESKQNEKKAIECHQEAAVRTGNGRVTEEGNERL